jgi:hypothetical protein
MLVNLKHRSLFVSGIEVLSVQPKGTFNKYMGPSSPDDLKKPLTAMPSISDEDIEFELRLEETAKTQVFLLLLLFLVHIKIMH